MPATDRTATPDRFAALRNLDELLREFLRTQRGVAYVAVVAHHADGTPDDVHVVRRKSRSAAKSSAARAVRKSRSGSG